MPASKSWHSLLVKANLKLNKKKKKNTKCKNIIDMGRSLSERSDSIGTKILNKLLMYGFFTVFIFFGSHFKPYKFLIDFLI